MHVYLCMALFKGDWTLSTCWLVCACVSVHVCDFAYSSPPSQLPRVPYPTVMSVLIIDNVLVGNQLLEVKTHLSYVRQVACTPCKWCVCACLHTYIYTYMLTYVQTYIRTYEHVCTFGVLLCDCSGVCLCSLCTAEDELSPADRHSH